MRNLQPITVSTYDSAYTHLERWANRFALLVFDECHHLPGPSYMSAAIGAIAPYRMGLTATPERNDGAEALLESLIGPVVFRREIKELSGQFLADYRTERLYVELTEEEAAALSRELTADGVDPLAGTALAATTEEQRRQRLRQSKENIHYDNAIWLSERRPKGLTSL